MVAQEAPERAVIINAQIDGNRARYWSVQTGRWATVTTRDWWDDPGARRYIGDDRRREVVEIPGPVFRRDPSFAIALSDGRQVGGEMSAYCAVRIACEWVREGR